ncbi:MAG: ABC transporter permease subunit [Bdellovibrionota bacterium]
MYRHIPTKRSFGWADIFVLATVALLIYGFVGLAQQWAGAPVSGTEIDLSVWALPKYSFFSFMRALAAYALSLIFTLVYGYAAAKSKRAERVMLPLLDILQSIPVLGFLPGLVLGLVSVFPNSNIGLEIACILMIFTGQAWNMTFSFYSSVKAVPLDLSDVTRVMRLSWLERVRHLELPFAAIGLAWNSLMSMAGGWFFLAVCESITLGSKRFELPGIGSYMALAIDHKDHQAMLYGVLAMCAVILFVDFVIWRPVMAWVRKFQMEEIPEEVAELPFMTTLLRESWLIRRFRLFVRNRRRRNEFKASTASQEPQNVFGHRMKIAVIRERIRRHKDWGLPLLARVGTPVTVMFALWGGTRLWELVRTLTLDDWQSIWIAVGLTFLRVLGAVVFGTLWTVPVGILIGLSPRLTRIFQPIVQLAASFPAPMLYPVIIAVLLNWGVSMNWGAVFLLALGVQWYILFNVLAGAMAVTRDLKDSMRLMGTSASTRWLKLYLPSVFPSLVTGWISATGGAWNASIVAEYIHYGNQTLAATGIGSMISQATAAGDFPLVAGCLIAMVCTVVGLNQTWWRWLHEQAETRFRFER